MSLIQHIHQQIKEADYIKEISVIQRTKLSMMGFRVISEFEAGDYQVILLRHEQWHGGSYVVGFQYQGEDFTEEDTQYSDVVTNVNLKDLAKIPPRLRQWVNEHGEIIIGSHNLNKLNVYKRLFQRYNYNITDISNNEFTIS